MADLEVLDAFLVLPGRGNVARHSAAADLVLDLLDQWGWRADQDAPVSARRLGIEGLDVNHALATSWP